MSYPETTAERVLGELGINDPAQLAQLTEIAYARGAIIREVEMEGAEARLTVLASEAVISLSKAVSNQQRKRFSIAHELGHLEMHKATANLIICQKRDISYTGMKGSSSLEDEANQFASGFLLPSRFVQKSFESEPSFEVIQKVAEQFNTSLTATALRFLSFSKEPVAVVYTEENRIKWFQATKDFFDAGVFVEVKTKLDQRTKAANLFKGLEIPIGWKKVPASSWLKEGSYKRDAVVSEWSIGMPRYNAVLTLLWVDDEIYDEEW